MSIYDSNKDYKSDHEELAYLKGCVTGWFSGFKENIDRYHEFRHFVFNTALDDNKKSVLNALRKPIVEANSLEAYLSRFCGEFAQNEPSIDVYPADGSQLPQKVIEFVEMHLRHALYEADIDQIPYDVYKESLSGGYSSFKVWTEYESPMSMKQIIKIGKPYENTLTGFDLMARLPHKGDGNFSFEIFPMTEKDFKLKYPDIDLSGVDCSLAGAGFSWAYTNFLKEKIIIVCELYKKKKVKRKIVELADGSVGLLSNYNKVKKRWDEEGVIEQIPQIVRSRMTEIEVIFRYEFIGDRILKEEETDYTFLPHVFVDGNSIQLRQGTSNYYYQMTRPFVYHARGIQDMKNYALQTLGSFLENIVQHKFIVKKEAIPQEKPYQDALTNVQDANTLVVNAYNDNDPNQPIPDPIREVNLVPAPPEVMGTLAQADPAIQTVIGSFASNLNKNDNDLSGNAVIEILDANNGVVKPYTNSYLIALTRVAEIFVDLLPKYTPELNRSLPVVRLDGEKDYMQVNNKRDPNSPILDYQSGAIKVKLMPGVNFQVQKNKAMMQLQQLMSVSQEFNAFMNSDKGLPILVKNLTIYGADELKEAIPAWLQEKKQQQQQAMQMQQQAMMQNPQMIKAQADMQKNQIQQQELQIKAQKNQVDAQLGIAKLSIEKELADAKIMESRAKIDQEELNDIVRLTEAQTSLETHALDKVAKMAEIKSREHDTHRENIRLHHEITSNLPTKTSEG